MNSLSLAVLVIAGLASLVSPVASHPGTLSFPFSKSLNPYLSKRQAGTLNNVITDIQEREYFINFTLGTPPQSFAVQLDTGSSDFIVVGAGSPICNIMGNCVTGTYDQGASTTSSNTTLMLHNNYGDGTQVSGYFVQNTLGLDGQAISNVYFGVVTTGQTPNAFVGIMGVGYDTNEGTAHTTGNVYPNIIDSLASSGQIASKTFSLWLDDLASSTGTVLFGGIDTSKFNGDLTIVDVIPDSPGMYVEYTVALVGMAFTSSEASPLNVNLNGPLAVVLDCGSTLTMLPPSVLASLAGPLGLTVNGGYVVIPCSAANSDAQITFQFGGASSPVISVSLSELVMPATPTICIFGIQPANAPYILGDTFLRSAYVLFNQEDNVIGLAQANTNPGPSNIIALSSTSSGTISIPSGTPVSSQVTPSMTSMSTTSDNAGFGPVGPTISSTLSTTPSSSLVSTTSSISTESSATTSSTSSLPSSTPSTFISSSTSASTSSESSLTLTTSSMSLSSGVTTMMPSTTATSTPSSSVPSTFQSPSATQFMGGARNLRPGFHVSAWISTGLVALAQLLESV